MVLRAVLSLFLLLAQFAPYAIGLVPGAAGTDCGMACCKRSGVCCCKQSGDASPHWKAVAACDPGCRRTPAVRAAAALAILPGETSDRKLDAAASFIALPTATGHRSVVHPALFERPPPAFSC